MCPFKIEWKKAKSSPSCNLDSREAIIADTLAASEREGERERGRQSLITPFLHAHSEGGIRFCECESESRLSHCFAARGLNGEPTLAKRTKDAMWHGTRR